ncbi:cation:dicarboxylate symporter family transporter [Parvimonas micra]
MYCWFNPFKMLMKIKEPMLTAFVTRSFAAALPISLRVAKLSGLVEEDE